jgi:dTMP kinase
VCERFTMSTDAYQGVARGLGLKTTKALNAIATGGLKPDLTVVLDIPIQEFDSRDQGRALDRLEREHVSFRVAVRKGYRALARSTPKTILIDATKPAAEISALILAGALK